jgi:hypothetical protein
MAASDVDNLEGPASAGMDGKTCLMGLSLGAIANTGFLGGGEYFTSIRMVLSGLSAYPLCVVRFGKLTFSRRRPDQDIFRLFVLDLL